MRWAIVIWLCFAGAAFAQTSPEEQRARDIGAQLRCVVCQNQSIEESDAQLAQDMRIVVREQLATGASNEDVIEHIRDAYGDYVLLKPPVQSNTYARYWFYSAWAGSRFGESTRARQTRLIPSLTAMRVC